MTNKILSWKLFLESINNDDELKNSVSELKKALAISFESVFIIEKMTRIVGNKQKLEEGADYLIDVIFEMFANSVYNHPSLSEEFKEIIVEKFDKSLKSNRTIFIQKSFLEGVEKSIDFLIDFLEDMKRKMNAEGEEWKQPKDLNIEDMSKSEIQELIDTALDNRDFKQVEFLAKYLKESFELKEEDKEKIGQFIDRLVDLIANFYPIL